MMAKSESPPVTAKSGSRSLRLWLLLPSLLAFTVTSAIIAAAVLGLFRPSPKEFQRRATAAFDAKKPREALIWLRRQINANSEDMEARMQLVEAYMALNQHQLMFDHLNQIAPSNQVVYGPAHLYRAELIMAGGIANPENRANAMAALELASQADPAMGQGTVDQDLVASLMVKIQMAGNDWKGALATFAKISSPSPATRLLAAIALKNLDRKTEAYAAADKAQAEIQATAPDPSLEERSRRAELLAQAAMVKDDLQLALDTALSAGDEPPIKQLQASVAHHVANRYRTSGDAALWLDTMLRGLSAAPTDARLTTELLEGAEWWSLEPDFATRCSTRLTESGLDAHELFLAAHSNMEQKLPDEALPQFKNAWKLLPENPIIAHAYAAQLATQEHEADAQDALAIMETVLKNHPGIPDFQLTQGRILLRLDRLEEAIISLKLAVKGKPTAAIHLALAEAYTRLGNLELAASHRNQAGEL